MKKSLTHLYVLALWLLCGEALDAMLEAWWPAQRAFWSYKWTGGLTIALIAIVIVLPAAMALERGARPN